MVDLIPSFLDNQIREYLSQEEVQNRVENSLPYKLAQQGRQVAQAINQGLARQGAKEGLIKDRSELPNRNTDRLPYPGQQIVDPFGAAVAAGDYIYHAAENPQNAGEFGLSWAANTGESIGDYILSLFGAGEDKEGTPKKTWLETYLAQGGPGGGAGMVAGGQGGEGIPFPEISLGMRDIDTSKVKAPQYEGNPYNVWDVLAAGFANADFSGKLPDFSKAVNEMNRITAEGNKSVTDAKNAMEEARASAERWQVAQEFAKEEMRQRNALAQANMALAKWQAMQPRALGGNKTYWRDANGNIHWEQVDKQGEARTLGQNAALSDLAQMSDKELSRMTPKKIMQRAQQQSLLLQDKNSQIPFMQNYYIQGLQMIQGE